MLNQFEGRFVEERYRNGVLITLMEIRDLLKELTGKTVSDAHLEALTDAVVESEVKEEKPVKKTRKKKEVK
jgi:hypothetical protein